MPEETENVAEGASPSRCEKRACSATFRTAQRIGYLRDPSSLDTLLDAFQSQGMPMGSDRWAEYCHARLLELAEKERTLNKLLRAKSEMDSAEQHCGSVIHRTHRQRMTKEFQDEQRERDRESIEKYERETGKKFY